MPSCRHTSTILSTVYISSRRTSRTPTPPALLTEETTMGTAAFAYTPTPGPWPGIGLMVGKNQEATARQPEVAGRLFTNEDYRRRHGARASASRLLLMPLTPAIAGAPRTCRLCPPSSLLLLYEIFCRLSNCLLSCFAGRRRAAFASTRR